MEYRRIDKNNPPIDLLALSLKDQQKTFLDSLPTILKEYGSIDNWIVLSIHLSDFRRTTIGFAVIGSFGPNETWLDDIMIDQKYQGMGYGTEALKDCIDFIFKTYDVNHFYLSCFKENEVALKLYKKLGFILTDDLDINGELILVYYK